MAFITNRLQVLICQINNISLLSISWQFLIQWIKLGRKTAHKHKGNKSRGGVKGKEEGVEENKLLYRLRNPVKLCYRNWRWQKKGRVIARFSNLYHLLRVVSGKSLSWFPLLQLAQKDKIRPRLIIKPIMALTDNNGQFNSLKLQTRPLGKFFRVPFSHWLRLSHLLLSKEGKFWANLFPISIFQLRFFLT